MPRETRMMESIKTQRGHKIKRLSAIEITVVFVMIGGEKGVDDERIRASGDAIRNWRSPSGTVELGRSK